MTGTGDPFWRRCLRPAHLGLPPAEGPTPGQPGDPEHTRRPILLVLTLDFPPSTGGIQRLLAQLCGGVQHFSPQVIAPVPHGIGSGDGSKRAGPDDDFGFPVLRVRPPALPGVGRNAELLAIAAAAARLPRGSTGPDYVLAGHVRLAPVAAVLAGLWRVPFAVSVFGREVGSDRVAVLRAAQSWALRRATRTVAISRFTADRAIACGALPDRICIVPPSVGQRFLDAPRDPLPARRWVDDGRPVLLTVGRLDQAHKGHDTIIRALPEIRHAVPRVAYVIAGAGALQRELLRLAGTLGVGDCVVFAGKATDTELLALYDRCDLFAMPSRVTASGDVEGFGIVFLEAAARGKPAIAARAGGVEDAVLDGVTGIVLNDATPESFAAAAIALLRDPDRRRQLGQAGARRAREAFSPAAVAKAFEECLLGEARRDA